MLRLVSDDITNLAVDAIVNAANETLLGGGGVDGAIHRAAGPDLREACRRITEIRPGVRCQTGDARVTPGFSLHARFVIHTVGPVWRGGSEGEADQLASCYRRVFELARQYRIETIAFPAISCGAYGFPHRKAATIAIKEICAAHDDRGPFKEVLLVAFDQSVREALAAALREPDRLRHRRVTT